MKRSRKNSADGFTLIEVMFALALLGMIVAAVYSSWRAIMRGAKAGVEAAATVQRARMAVRTVENALTSARSFAADIDNYAFLAKNGSDASLSFVSQLPYSFPRGGKFGDYYTRRVAFSLEPAPGSMTGKQLVLRQSPVLLEMERDRDEMEHPVVLAHNVKEFSMQFWDKKAQEWVDEWAQTNQLPQMVLITMQFTGDDPSSPMKEEVTRLIALPSVMVQAAWQMPNYNPSTPFAPPKGPIAPGQ